MGYDRRLKALESAFELKRNGRRYDMSMLTDQQLELVERVLRDGAEIDGTTYLRVDDLTDDELAELEKALRLTGVLRNGEKLK